MSATSDSTMRHNRFKRTRLACYTAYFTMSSVFSLPPLLFVTFHEKYGISFTLLGTLVLVNFCTQLAVDLLFTFLSSKMNIKAIVRCMPLITSAGLLIYALSPAIFGERVYLGLLLGTFLFSVSAGLSEVLLSPMISAMPSDDPKRDMSLLHSLYAFGIVTVILISTVFLRFFGEDDWTYLVGFFAALPILAAVLFMLSPIPDMTSEESASREGGGRRRTAGLAFCVACIFFGSCSENVMSNWTSGYVESAFGIDKSLGDILGMAMFGILLGVGRIAYSRFGKRIFRVLMGGMLGAAVCYLLAGFSQSPAVALIACALTGLFTSMLWPGSLIMMEERLPHLGVTAYALMAAGGDLGASVAPQLMGAVVDGVSASRFASELSASLGLTAEQIGMKTGMIVSAIFPIAGAVLLFAAMRYFKRTKGIGRDSVK